MARIAESLLATASGALESSVGEASDIVTKTATAVTKRKVFMMVVRAETVNE